MTPTRFSKVRAQICGPADLFLAVRIAAWVVALRVLKYLLPLPTLVRVMSRPAGASSDRAFERERCVIALARWACRLTDWPRGNCLERGLVTYRYLSGLGARPLLVVGLARAPHDAVRGHVWVVVDGRAIDETTESLARFERFTTFGDSGLPIPSNR